VPEPFDFDSSIDEPDFIEEIEDSQKLSYTDLEISFDPSEEFDYEAEPEQVPALAEQPVEIDCAHETQVESASFARTNDALIETEQAEVFHFAEPSVDEAIASQSLGDLSDYVESEAVYQDEQAFDEAQEIGAKQNEAVNYNSAIDPWDDPLPAWDQSRNEWPIMLAPQKPSSMKKLRALLGLAIIIAIGVAAYFLFLQRPADTPLPKQLSTMQKSPVAALTPEAEKANTAAASEPTAPQASAPAETAETSQPVRETTETMSEGRFTLQLASMPNEAAANEMADGLKSNGLPAYVARANLGSRGIWYRVRVGNFQTAEDAKSFAAKSRLDARVERTDN
jgi:cell division septation protein DedD